MAKIKRLRSVIQSTAHHGVSGLCYLHPHLGQQCKTDGITTVTLDLFTGTITPKLSNVSNEIELSKNAFIEKFNEILSSENFEKSEVSNVIASFQFDENSWAKYCCIELVTDEGQKLEVAVSSMGEIGEIFRTHS